MQRGPVGSLALPRIRGYFHGRKARLLGFVLVVVLLIAGVLWLAGARGVYFGFLLGADIAVFGCFIAWMVVEHSGARAPLVGALGEEWSADVLARLGKRWSRIDNVPFGPTLDVDHVLVSPAGVFAVETKFTATDWTALCPALLRAVDNARWKARKVGFLLDRAGKPSVTPMLIIWGPGAPSIPGGFEMVDGVLVCRGADADRWRAYLRDLPTTLEADRIGEMVDVIADHTERTEAANAAPDPIS